MADFKINSVLRENKPNSKLLKYELSNLTSFLTKEPGAAGGETDRQVGEIELVTKTTTHI